MAGTHRAGRFSVLDAVRSVGTRGPRRFIVKQSLRPISGGRDFSRAFTLCGRFCRVGSVRRIGQRLKLTVTGLRRRTTYYYAVKAIGDSGSARTPRGRELAEPYAGPGLFLEGAAQRRNLKLRRVRLPATSRTSTVTRCRPRLRRLAGTRSLKDVLWVFAIRLPSSNTVALCLESALAILTRTLKLREVQRLGKLPAVTRGALILTPQSGTASSDSGFRLRLT